jgi:Raf kinase inhibitor-like YbhB/YbcL family protein
MRFPRVVPVIFVVLCAAARAEAGGLCISSPDFADGALIPARFTCEGQNVPPTLEIAGTVAGARTLALVVEDPDAPSGTFTHWIVWNIPPGVTRLSAGALPAGVREGTNDFGTGGYSGPCPPSGTHRYYFRLSALDTALRLPAGARRQEFDAAIDGHVLASAEWMGRYAKGSSR